MRLRRRWTKAPPTATRRAVRGGRGRPPGPAPKLFFVTGPASTSGWSPDPTFSAADAPGGPRPPYGPRRPRYRRARRGGHGLGRGPLGRTGSAPRTPCAPGSVQPEPGQELPTEVSTAAPHEHRRRESADGATARCPSSGSACATADWARSSPSPVYFSDRLPGRASDEVGRCDGRDCACRRAA